MTLHRASGRWRLGLVLALSTAAFWATLPVALKVALEVVDPWTLTWFRFLVAAVLMGTWLARRDRLRGFGRLRGIFVFRSASFADSGSDWSVLVVGLLVFFFDQVSLDDKGMYLGGSLLLVLAAATWAIYQKQLLLNLHSTAVMGFIYGTATLMLWPTADPSRLLARVYRLRRQTRAEVA